MRSAFAMLLAAGLAACDVPQKLTGETEERLDLSGEWEGTWQDERGQVGPAHLHDDGMTGIVLPGEFGPWFELFLFDRLKDEGKGQFQASATHSHHFLGVYHQDGTANALQGLGKPRSCVR